MRFPKILNGLFLMAILFEGKESKIERLSIADWGDGYHEHGREGTYAFGYDIDDPMTGNTQYRNEERHANGSVTGSYGLVEPDGNVRVVHYVADSNGFRVNIMNSDKENGVFQPPTTAFIPSTDSESSETQTQVSPIQQQPIKDQSTEPPSNFLTPLEEGIESAQGVNMQPQNIIVLPGGIKIEIPQESPDDNKLGPQSTFHSREEYPVFASKEVSSQIKNIQNPYSPLQALIFQPYSMNNLNLKRGQYYHGHLSYNPFLTF